jgi:hypothetical protein
MLLLMCLAYLSFKIHFCPRYACNPSQVRAPSPYGGLGHRGLHRLGTSPGPPPPQACHTWNFTSQAFPQHAFSLGLNPLYLLILGSPPPTQLSIIPWSCPTRACTPRVPAIVVQSLCPLRCCTLIAFLPRLLLTSSSHSIAHLQAFSPPPKTCFHPGLLSCPLLPQDIRIYDSGLSGLGHP